MNIEEERRILEDEVIDTMHWDVCSQLASAEDKELVGPEHANRLDAALGKMTSLVQKFIWKAALSPQAIDIVAEQLYMSEPPLLHTTWQQYLKAYEGQATYYSEHDLNIRHFRANARACITALLTTVVGAQDQE